MKQSGSKSETSPLRQKADELEMQNKELKMAKSAAQDAADKYNELYDFEPCGYFTLSREGNIIELNLSGSQMLGKERSLLKNNLFGFFVSDDTKQIFNLFLGKLFDSKAKESCEVSLSTSGNLPKHVYLTGIANANGKQCHVNVIEIDGLLKEITEYKQMEELLQKSEKKFRNYIESSGDIMYVVDNDLKFLYGNQKYLERRGLTIEELLTKEYRDYHSDEGTGKFMERVKDVRISGKPVVYEYQSETDGRYFLRTLSPMIDPETMEIESLTVISRDIIELKKIELELCESRYMLQTVLDTIPAGVFWKDRNLFYLGGNSNWLKAAGLKSAEEVIGKSDYDLAWDKKQSNLFREQDKKVLESGIPEFDIIESFTKADGTLSWTRTHKVPLRDKTGNIIGILGTYEDITKIKQAEEALREGEEKYRNLFNNCEVGMFRSRLDGSEILEFNKKYLEILGYTSDELHGAPSVNMWVNKQERENMVQKLKAEGHVTDLECELLNKQGEVIHCITSLRLYPDTGNLEGSIHDITKLKQSEKILREKEEELRFVLNSAPVTIFATDEAGVFTLHEGKAVKEVGMKPGENVGVSAFDLYPSLSFKEHTGKETKGEDVLNRVLTGETVSGITELRGVCFDNRITPIRDENQKITGIVGVAIDITQRMQSENALRESLIRYRELVENINNGVAVYEAIDDGMDFIFKDFNRAGERIDNDKRERLLGKRISEVRPGLEEFGLLDVLRRVWLTGKPESFPARMYKDKGISGWYKNFVYKLPSGEIVAVFDNVSKQKQVEDDLSNALDMLKELYIYRDDTIENERKAISREIHDELGQLLSVLKIDLNWTKANYGKGEEAIKKIYSMIDIVNDTIKSVQRISSDLRPGILDDLGLIPAMEWFCQEFEKRTGIKCHLNLGDFESTNEKKNLALYRILQEATTNVMRHANAKNLYVKCIRGEDSVFLEIMDDGTGMKQEKIDSSKSLGLIGMRERIKQFDGRLDIKSTMHVGTTISVYVPIN
jgi:PAS domain S-box-containing protein